MGTVTEQTLVLIVTNNAAATCSAAQTASASGGLWSYENVTALTFTLNASSAIRSGTYAIEGGESGSSEAKYTVGDAMCAQASLASATSGSVTVSAISAEAVSGSFDVTFGANPYAPEAPRGHVTGSFSIPICPLPNGQPLAITGSGPFCQQ